MIFQRKVMIIRRYVIVPVSMLRDEDGDGINEVHVNTMEGIWSLLRQYIRTFRGVCKKYLHLYVNAFEFLHNLKWRISDGFLGLLTTILTPHESGT
jgi:transposase